MRRAPVLERIGIVPKPFTLRVQRGVAFPHRCAQLGVVVDALGTGHDFLAAHEEVVGVGEGGVGGIGGGVERADGGGEFVDGVEVCGVFLEHYFAKGFLVGGAGGRDQRCWSKR